MTPIMPHPFNTYPRSRGHPFTQPNPARTNNGERSNFRSGSANEAGMRNGVSASTQSTSSPLFGNRNNSLFGQLRTSISGETDSSLHRRQSTSLFGRPNTPLFRERTEKPRLFESQGRFFFGRADPSLFERPESPLSGTPDNSLLGKRTGTPLFDRPDKTITTTTTLSESISGKAKTSLALQLDKSPFQRPDTSLVDRADRSVSDGTETRNSTETPMVVRTQQDITEIQSILDERNRIHNQPKHLRRNPRWRNTKPEPLTDPKDLPLGWNMNEPDLDPKDYEAQIERCHDRIEANIMPHIFRDRLEVYEKMLERRKKKTVQWPSHLSESVKSRLDSLNKILYTINKKGDRHGDKQNVEAIMTAYYRGKLEWNVEAVTYWLKGKKVGKSKRYRPKTLKRVQEKNGTFEESGYWATGPGSVNQLRTVMRRPQDPPRRKIPDPERLKSPKWEGSRRRRIHQDGKGPKSRLVDCETIEY